VLTCTDLSGTAVPVSSFIGIARDRFSEPRLLQKQRVVCEGEVQGSPFIAGSSSAFVEIASTGYIAGPKERTPVLHDPWFAASWHPLPWLGAIAVGSGTEAKGRAASTVAGAWFESTVTMLVAPATRIIQKSS
jgi:hypothetical protein